MDTLNGITKKIDSLGRITIPKAWRQVCQLNYGDEVVLFLVDNETIGIRKKESTLSNKEVQTLHFSWVKCREGEKYFENYKNNC